jgi:aspartyl/asparaginyl beta-hydroxylase (cupin superfamily)
LLTNLPHNIPQPPIDPTTTKEWIKEIAIIWKKIKKEARKIVLKHTNKNIQ